MKAEFNFFILSFICNFAPVLSEYLGAKVSINPDICKKIQ